MKLRLTAAFAILLLAPVAATAEEAIPGLVEAASADLPPEGTASLFDRLVQREGGVPFPVEALARSVAAMSGSDGPPLSVLIPAGRSLVRDENSFRLPRLLLAATGPGEGAERSDSVLLKDRLFIGYSEPIDQLEVISYNPEFGRFEYQIVDDYREGAVPRILHARRAFCLGCHQGAAPIFPLRPWQESNAQADIAQAMAAAGVGGQAAGPDAGPEGAYHGVPLRISLDRAEAFDNAVAAANGLLIAQDFWRQGCGGQQPGASSCRRLLLAQALSFALEPGLFDPESPGVQRLLAEQAKLWPKAGLTLFDSSIPDRDPPAEMAESWFAGKLAWLGFGDAAETVVIPPDLDPRSPRPPARVLDSPSVDAVLAVASFFGPDDRRLLHAALAGDPDQPARDSQARLREAVLEAAPDSLFGAGPLQRAAVVTALLEIFGQPVPASLCCERPAAPLPLKMVALQPLELAPDSDLKPFERYCFGCHRGNPVTRLDFLRGENEGEVWSHLREARQLDAVLDWEQYKGTLRSMILMPPANSPEKAHLEAVMAQGDDPLGAMREAIAERRN